jgi:hypothetical protein
MEKGPRALGYVADYPEIIIFSIASGKDKAIKVPEKAGSPSSSKL